MSIYQSSIDHSFVICHVFGFLSYLSSSSLSVYRLLPSIVYLLLTNHLLIHLLSIFLLSIFSLLSTIYQLSLCLSSVNHLSAIYTLFCLQLSIYQSPGCLAFIYFLFTIALGLSLCRCFISAPSQDCPPPWCRLTAVCLW